MSEFCNLACVHCPYEIVTKLKGAQRKNLDPDLHTKIVSEIVEEGMPHCRFVRYTGDGEPTLHPKLPQMIADLKNRTGIQTNLTTNGLLMTQARAEAYLDAGVDVFDISIDAFKEETYRQVRVNGELADLLVAVRLLLAENKKRGKPAKIVVSFVHQPLNEGEADDFRAFWNNEGVDFVVIRDKHSCAGEMKETAQEMWSTAPTQRTPCRYPWERLVVKPDGKVVFCPADWYHKAEIGHVKDNTIGEIWRGEKMQALRQAHVTNRLENHSFCRQCPDWQVIPWPGQNKDYASMMKLFQNRDVKAS
ncbi:radical SAM/SPASM domain-containing protein [Coralliovum pocilloporae]|uniref:radical SAM/SPASM domain-containing protein n=1 Tax=Coralliovum pocilloporae TaxID=3066369 RepID=UPI003306F877